MSKKQDVKVHGFISITNHFELMMISALRYAIGRYTYMPSVTIEYIRYLIPQLSAKTLFIMKRDIGEEIERYQRMERELYMNKEWKKLADEIGDMYEKKKAVQE
jgi:hypothetical protein